MALTNTPAKFLNKRLITCWDMAAFDWETVVGHLTMQYPDISKKSFDLALSSLIIQNAE